MFDRHWKSETYRNLNPNIATARQPDFPHPGPVKPLLAHQLAGHITIDDIVSIYSRKTTCYGMKIDKAKPAVRRGRKATGLRDG